MTQHEFTIVLDPFIGPPAVPDAYDRLRKSPPHGCRIDDDNGQSLVIACSRLGASRVEAIISVVGEIRQRFGIAHADDLGFEKLWEWSTCEMGEDLTLQLLLMAARRAEVLGWDHEKLVRLLRAVALTP